MSSVTKQISSLNKPKVIWLLGIILLAIFFRFFMLSSYPPSLYADEAVNGINTLRALESHQFKIFYQENNGREGLFINVQAFFVWLFGPEMWALHIAGALFGVLTVLGLYFLTRELMLTNKESRIMNNGLDTHGSKTSDRYSLFLVNNSTLIALVSTFFLSISFWHINFSRIGFRAITALFWSVWAFYFFFIAQKKLLADKERIDKSFWPWSLLAGAIFGLGFNSYISYRVLPVVLGLLFVYLFFKAKRAKILKDFFIAISLIVLGAIITASPLLVHFAQFPQDFLGRTSQVSVFSSATLLNDLLGNILKTVGMFNVAGDLNQRQNIAGAPQLFWPVGLTFLLGLYAVCKVTIKTIYKFFLKKSGTENRGLELISPAVSFFLLLWFAIGALPVMISNEGIPHALRSIVMILPTFILAGMGAISFYSWLLKKISDLKNKKEWLRTLHFAISLIAILLVLQTFSAYFIVWGENPATKSAFSYDYNQKAYEIRNLPKDVTKYVIYDPGDIGINITQFLTNTATPKSQIEHNLYYVPRNQIDLAHLPENILVTELK